MRSHRKRTYRKRKRLNAGPVEARLRRIRGYFGYRQYEMADFLGISRAAYGKNERGIHMIDLISIIAIHDKLGVSLEWLLFNRGPMFWKTVGDKKQKRTELQTTDSFTGELDQMIAEMKGIPLLRHAVMGFYQKFRIENDQVIRQFLGQE